MPTNEERREVAENLRNMTAYGCRYAEQFYELLQETVMDSWDFHSFDDVANRLADLIEPEPERTCRNVYDSEYSGEFKIPGCENGFECSDCGEVVEDYESYKVRGTWNYCPGCGAKVVEHD